MQYEWLRQQAERKISEGEFKEAVSLLQRLRGACVEKKQRGFVEKRLGEVYLHLKFLDKARVHFQQSINLNGSDAQGHYLYGLTLYLSGKPEAGAASLRKAIALQPGEPDVYHTLSLVLSSMGRWHQAEMALRQALEFNPHHVPSLVELGRLLAKKGQPRQASLYLRRSLQIDPDQTLAKQLLQTLGQRGRGRLTELERTEQVEQLFLARMEEAGYDELQRERARKLWRDFVRRRRLHLRKPQVWAAAIHYAMSRLEFFPEENQKELAARYEVSSRSISSAFQDICATLRLRLFDRRYSTQNPPFDDPLEEY